MSEAAIQQDIRLALGSTTAVRVFRNNVGECDTKDGRHIRYGLVPGSGDLIGWQTVVITPDMVGQRFARFLSIEVKAPKGVVPPHQRNWAAAVVNAGGIAIVARSVEDVQFLVAD